MATESAPLGFGDVLYYRDFKGESRVRVAVTNLSEANLLLFDRRGWARVEGPQGWVTNYLGSRGSMESVKPGASFVETLPIVPGATRWQIGYFVPTKSPKEKAQLATGWRRRVFDAMGPMISDRKPPAKEFWSEIFTLTNALSDRK